MTFRSLKRRGIFALNVECRARIIRDCAVVIRLYGAVMKEIKVGDKVCVRGLLHLDCLGQTGKVLEVRQSALFPAGVKRCKVDFNGNEIDVDRDTTVEIKDVGATKIEVPEVAMKKLNPPSTSPAK